MMRTFDFRLIFRVFSDRKILNTSSGRLRFRNGFGQLVRYFATAEKASVDSTSVESVDEIEAEIRKYRQLTVRKTKLISHVFGVSDEESKALLNSIGQLKHNSVTMIYDKIKLLQSYDIPLSAIKTKFHVLQLRFSVLQLRLEEMGMFDVDWSKDAEEHLEELVTDEEFIRGQWKKKRALLAYCLQCSEEKIDKISSENSEIYNISLKKLKKNLNILLAEKMVDKEIIFRSFVVLTSNSDRLEENLEFVKQLIREEVKGENQDSELNVRDLLKLESSAKNLFTSMMMMKMEKLAELRERLRNCREILGGRTHHEYLAERLDCDLSTVKKMLIKYPKVRIVRLEKLKNNLDILLKSGYITTGDIISYPTLLSAMPQSIERRIQQLDEIGFSDKRRFLTVFRNFSDEHFNRVTLQFQMEREILQEAEVSNKQEYFCKRLGCSGLQYETLFSANPRLSHIKLTKLKSVIDFLHVDCNLSSREILSLPTVFSASLEMMMARKKELDELGKVVTVRLLCLPSKQFKHEMNIAGGGVMI